MATIVPMDSVSSNSKYTLNPYYFSLMYTIRISFQRQRYQYQTRFFLVQNP
jgi:hypothetical protein